MKKETNKDVKKELKKYASAKRKKSNEWFFKTGKGEYGEGDKFVGVSLSGIRKVSKKYSDINIAELKKLLCSKIHEERLVALLILVDQFKKSDDKNKSKIFKFYLKNKVQINNWDLVDVSAHKIVGEYILENPKEKTILIKLAVSKSLWDRRIAIISTLAFIREDKISETLRLSKKLLSDKEDLMHKATGWMLREAWKKDSEKVEEFLIKNYNKLPRTTLRYTIERMEETKRKKFLHGNFNNTIKN